MRWPFTGSRPPAGAGHLPEVGTPRGGVHASATFTGPEGIPDRRVHTSAIYRKVYPCRRVPATAIYRKVDPDRRVHALAIYRKPVPGWRWPFTGSRYPARSVPGAGATRLRRWSSGHRLGRMDGIMESMETKHV